jgi:hypothetical protein
MKKLVAFYAVLLLGTLALTSTWAARHPDIQPGAYVHQEWT